MWCRWELVVSILRSCKGYSLLDALTGLSILTILSSSVLPIYSHLYEEREVIHVRKTAVILLDQYWRGMVLEGRILPASETVEGSKFSFLVIVDKVCVSFDSGVKTESMICKSLPQDNE